MFKQQTLAGSFSLYGKGLHTGLSLTVTFNPAPENHGYKIQRIDLPGEPIIEAIAENVVDTSRGTVVAKGEARCSTIEHAMAALYALGIDNCLIQVNGPEFPILDGSSIQYVENIKRIGTVVQNAPKDFYVIKKKIEFRDEETGSSIIILPDDQFSITAMISFDSQFINSQFAPGLARHNGGKQLARFTGGTKNQTFPVANQLTSGHNRFFIKIFQVGIGNQLVEIFQTHLIFCQNNEMIPAQVFQAAGLRFHACQQRVEGKMDGPKDYQLVTYDPMMDPCGAVPLPTKKQKGRY